METLEQKIAQILQENKAQLVASLLARTSPTGISVQLQEALDGCARGTEKAQDEISKLRLQYAKKPDEYTEYQINLIDKQTKRAVKEAERRTNLIKTLKTKEAREAELLRCKNDTVYWFKNWAWTLDPRADSPLSVIPFLPFGFQEELILWLEDLIFTQRTDGLIEKSRDMGVSWIATAFVVKHWLFNDRFDALLGSRKEELVDSMGEMESLFEKIRFQIKLLPDWMLPPGFESKRDINFCRIINPHTGSTIGGESSNPDFGRAGRYSFVLLDEFASFPHGGYEAWAGCSQSSRSKISISTPKGKLNKHADLRFSRGIAGMAVKSIHWKRHPWKTEVWYRAQAKTMNKAEIAQELDIDYEASQPGQIFPMWSELYHVITWSEFADYFGEMAVENWDAALNGTEKPIYQIPRHWQLGRAQDWGSTEQHRCVTLYAARPGEGDKLRDSVFIFREYLPEVGATPRQVAKGIRRLEAQGREHERMAISVMSHEAKSERDTYCKEHALPFEPWATDYNAGIAQVQNYLEIRKNIPHPFRNYLTGTPRLFLIVDDTQGAAYWESEGARYLVKQPTDHKGLERLRMEMPRYHYPAAEEGKAVALRRPFKLYDDAIDCLRALAAMWFPQASLLTDEELKEKRLSKSLRRENIPNINPQDLASYWLSRQMALGELKDGERKDKHWRDKFWESNRGE